MSLRKFFNKKSTRIVLVVFALLVFLVMFMQWYHSNKFLPKGMSLEGEVYPVDEDSIDFLYDLTYEKEGEIVYNQKIFDNLFSHIDDAEKYILIDMFLWGKDEEAYRDLPQN